jgi:hypothetical protein
MFGQGALCLSGTTQLFLAWSQNNKEEKSLNSEEGGVDYV